MKRDYYFTFSEFNYGSIKITSDHQPTEDEVIAAIESGSAFIHDTEYTDITFDKAEPVRKYEEMER